ncbi:MAG: nitroreductase family protein [Caldilineales bacterium]|nr:nitroreductase family protein [Caldilineales bacterium]MDW8317018.1 nitroreductase family protein [Anaerolineae bacterium]
MAELWSVIRGRRSVRRYANRPVEDALVWRLLEAAHWAPSAHNRQPWRFVWVRPGERRRALAAAMAARWEADLRADGVEPVLAAERAARSQHRIETAPVVLVPCLDVTTLDPYPDPLRQQAEWQMGIQSVALACQNLLLMAHDLGLAACWMCAPLFCPEVVQATLALPAVWQPQALLTVGYPAPDTPPDKPRNPLEEHVVIRL